MQIYLISLHNDLDIMIKIQVNVEILFGLIAWSFMKIFMEKLMFYINSIIIICVWCEAWFLRGQVGCYQSK